MIRNTILITNGKGGVAKTSLVANLAGLAAMSGWRTLAIDTDPQGNIARDFGVINDTDDGGNLAAAILGTSPLQPMLGVRPGLDLVPGGPSLDAVPPQIQAIMSRGHYLSALGRLEAAVAPIADQYDLIVIDSPPGDRALPTLAARAARLVVVPTAPDDCSFDGLTAVFERLTHLRQEGGNPDLEILGGCAYPHGGNRASHPLTSPPDTPRASCVSERSGEGVFCAQRETHFSMSAHTVTSLTTCDLQRKGVGWPLAVRLSG